MAISAKDVMALRQKTGAGMMDCKKALNECDGDMDAAIKYLREKGMAAAKKRADREAKEGLVVIHVNNDNNTAAIVEVNSETDFVARNEEFVTLVDGLAEQAMELGPEKAQGTTLLAEDFDISSLKEFAGKVGENLSIGKAGYLKIAENGMLDTYIHPGSQLGVIIELKVDKNLAESNEIKDLSHDLTLQIAASAPLYVNSKEVSAETIENEKEIYKNQMRNEGKPEAIIEKIANGKINKYYEETCLINQPFVKEPKQKVSDRIAETEKAVDCKIEVVRFIRIKVGESK